MSTLKYLYLLARLTLAKKGTLLRTSLPQAKAGQACATTNKFCMVYEINGITEIQVLT
jgi:hypothetical protein